MTNRVIKVKGVEISIATRHEQDYISLTDMVRHFDAGGALIEQWLKNKDTVLFLGVWEQLNNPSLNSLELEGIKNEAGRNSCFLSAKTWINATGAIGLHAKAGRYGSSLAHKDIAFEFGSWLSPEAAAQAMNTTPNSMSTMGIRAACHGSPTCDILALTQPPRLCSRMRNLGGFFLAGSL